MAATRPYPYGRMLRVGDGDLLIDGLAKLFKPELNLQFGIVRHPHHIFPIAY